MRNGACCLLLLCACSYAWELSDVSRCAWEHNPRLSEDSVGLLQARNNYDKVKYGAILPRLELGVAFGPAPGFRYNYDSSLHVSKHTGSSSDSFYVRDSSTTYAWDHWGPYFGTQISVAQPLNVQQLRSGLSAAKSGIAVQEAALVGKRQDYLKEAAEYYLGYVFARTMIDILEPAVRKLDGVDSSLQAKLDNDEEDASQTDLLQLRASRLTADKGLDEARTGLERAEKGLRFTLGLRPEDPLLIADKEMFQFADLPPRDSLLSDLRSPDLRRLQAGIDAKRAVMEYKKATIGPTIAIFADFSYTKAWVANRNDASNKDVLVTDPINSTSGRVGLGFNWDLNFWSKKRDFIDAKLDMEDLRRKEVYARPGLESQLSEAYARYESTGRRLAMTIKARNAAESWLKAIALQVDADSSRQRDLISPYQKFIDLQHEYWDAVYQRDMCILEVLQKAGWLTPKALEARKIDPSGLTAPAPETKDSEDADTTEKATEDEDAPKAAVTNSTDSGDAPKADSPAEEPKDSEDP